MKLSKRILAVLLAGTMALALLAGCGSSVGSKDVDVINVMLQLNGSDVKVTIGALDMKGFLEEAEALVKKPAPVYNYGTTYGSNAKTYPGGSFVGTTSAAATKSAEKTETKTSNPALKTVTGAAAPKVNKENESNLMGYHKKNPNELLANWNSSCLPYEDALSN